METNLKLAKSENGLIGVIDPEGKWIEEPKYTSKSFEWEGMFLLQDETDAWGILGGDGEWIDEPYWEGVDPDPDDDLFLFCCEVWYNGDIWYLFPDGELKPKYECEEEFEEWQEEMEEDECDEEEE